MSDAVRRSWHCGWLPREEWDPAYAFKDGLFDGAFTADDGTVCDTCPGWLEAMPAIREAGRATWALRKNVLPQYYPDPSAVLLDAVQVIDTAFANFEVRQIEMAKAKG